MNSFLTLSPKVDRQPQELVVISGKGGTGKTSLLACFAALSRAAVLADCDVDAADLHLLLEPHIIHRESFTGGKRARIRQARCSACGKCQELCRFEAIHVTGHGRNTTKKTLRVDPIACEGCGVCAWFCPEQAIDFGPAANGEWYISATRFGPMVHAKLGVAEENSGKLVSIVRANAKRIAEEHGVRLLLIDGSPGIGCPVIASITGASLVLVVTEPTLSGLHDMERVILLTQRFGISTMVCVNKWDLNPEISRTIEATAQHLGVALAGKVRYDRAVTEAQVNRKTVVEYQHEGCSADIRIVWDQVKAYLEAQSSFEPPAPNSSISDSGNRRWRGDQHQPGKSDRTLPTLPRASQEKKG